MSLQIRLAQPQDIAQLIAVERSAAQLFHQQPGWRFIAEGPVMSAEQHADFIQRQNEWLAEGAAGRLPALSPSCRNSRIGISPNCLWLPTGNVRASGATCWLRLRHRPRYRARSA